MYLVIAEKKSVGQTIGKVIGAYKNEDGYMTGRDCVVSWCMGHLAEYVSPEWYDEKYKTWEFEDLPIIPEYWKMVVASEKKKQFDVLKQLLNRSDIDYVVNACDAGREGELIFQRVYELSGSKLPVKRLWISSMEDSAIQEGFSELKDGVEYENLCNASICRAKADWLVGMNATRAFTSSYRHKLIVGRVQTPTLAMLVERDAQIKGFQKKPYYNVELLCGDMTAVKEKLEDKGIAISIVQKCDGSEAIVEEIKEVLKVINPPKLYDLTTLQRENNRHFGYTAKETLDFAQNLYEKKLVTYPRTDSQFLTEDMGDTIRNVISIVKDVYAIDPFSYSDQPELRRVMNNAKVSDHHAIIPTAEIKKYDLQKLSDGEKKTLILIAIRLLCATSKVHKYQEKEAIIQCQGEDFKAKGKTIMENGWKDVEEYIYSLTGKKSEETSSAPMPSFYKGQRFTGVKATSSEHFTTPPKPYSEDTLLSAMEHADSKEFEEETEKKGLGTPATRANIIERLVNTGFVQRKGKQLLPTEGGVELILVLPEYLKSASMTAEWENQLLEMERGSVRPEEFMEGIYDLVNTILDGCRQISTEERYRFHTREEVGKCPACGCSVYEGKNNFYCENSDCKVVIWKDNAYLRSMKKQMDKTMVKALLKNGRVPVKGLYSAKKDDYFDAILVMDATTGVVQYSLEFPQKEK